jgi:hypothetical protein
VASSSSAAGDGRGATEHTADTPALNLTLPRTSEFKQTDLAGDYELQMGAAEK